MIVPTGNLNPPGSKDGIAIYKKYQDTITFGIYRNSYYDVPLIHNFQEVELSVANAQYLVLEIDKDKALLLESKSDVELKRIPNIDVVTPSGQTLTFIFKLKKDGRATGGFIQILIKGSSYPPISYCAGYINNQNEYNLYKQLTRIRDYLEIAIGELNGKQ